MDIQSLVQRLNLRDRRDLYLLLTVPFIAYPLVRIASSLLTPATRSAKIIRSPREALQLLSAQRLEDLPYPPNALPGGRDVDTPYGNIRVYEWGPETGRKVLFVHGISTPCIALASMAKMLVEQGCRVMLFDLFGRGYSDTPDPKQHHQDIQLFTSQIFLVLSSSKLAWTAERFTMVGYSLGGGVSAAFTSYFPDMVESLILIAPAGLIRPHHMSTSSKLLYGALLPDAVAEYFIYRRLKGGAGVPFGKGKPKLSGETPTTSVEAAKSEVPEHPALAANSLAPIFPDRPSISPATAVTWQLDAHPGFLAAFISSIKYAPITQQHERWRLIRRQQAAQTASSVGSDKASQGLKEGKVLILLGKQDKVIIPDEVEEDATEVLGSENVTVVKLEGAHDVPVVNAQGCVEAIIDFWG